MAKHEAHHGGAWKVAYADFVTAMMALFLVLWLSSQDTRIKEAVERAFRNPFSAVTKESTGIIPNKDATASYKQQGNFQSVSAVEMETMRHITEDLARILQQSDADKNVQLELTPDGLRVNVFDQSHKPIFEPDTDIFTKYGNWVFSTLAWEISRYKTFKVELEGHTRQLAENDPAAKESKEITGKWELSTERANAARRLLVQNGVTAAQVCKVSGYADIAPMAGLPATDEVNRRVTVLLKLKESVANLSASNSEPASDEHHSN